MSEDFNETDNSEEKIPGSEITPTMPPAKAAIFGLIIIFFLYQFGGGILSILIFGFNLENADVNALRLFTAAGQILLILAPALVLTKLVYIDVTTVLRIKIPTKKEVGIFIVGLIILIPLLQSFLYVQNYFFQQLAQSNSVINYIKEIFDQLNELLEQAYGNILAADSIIEILFVIIIISVVPAICEEVLFRGFVQRGFEYRFKPFTAIFITSLAFGLYHFNPYGLIALLILGMYLGYSVYLSGSILVPIILHFLHNLISILTYYIFGSEELMETNIVNPEEFSTHAISFTLLTLLFIIFLYFVKKYYYKFAKIEEDKNDLS